MDDLFPFLIGATGKFIDDIDDNNIQFNLYFKECLKSVNIVLFTLVSKNDFLFSFATFILSIFGAGIDTYYWKSFIAISLFLSILYFSLDNNWTLFFFIIILIIISSHFEEKQFPEEFSIKKLFTRIIGFIFFLSILYIPISDLLSKIFNYSIYIPNIIYIRKLILIALGGLSVSIISQIYFLL